MSLTTANRVEDLALFTRHVSGAMQARVPLPDILRAYLNETESSRLARAVQQIIPNVEAGESLSAAMENYPGVFPASYRRLIWLGEQGHSLGGVTARLAESLEEALKSYEYFRRAAIYPLFVLVLLLLDVIFIGIMIAPKFQAIYAELGAQVPGLAANPSQLARMLLWCFAGLLIIPVIFLWMGIKRLRYRGIGYGRGALQMPFLGPVLRKAETARFARDLALLLENKVPMPDALELLAESADNSYVRAALHEFHKRYTAGESLGALVADQPLFPPAMATLIASAEDQGSLPETLRGLGRYYAERTGHGLAVLRETFEPMMLLLIGLLVALILISFYGPLFTLPKMIR